MEHRDPGAEIRHRRTINIRSTGAGAIGKKGKVHQGAAQAHEFDVSDMTEIAAGLRTRQCQPFSTSIKDRQHNKRVGSWNTGDDLITAIQRHSSTGQKCLIGYGLNRLYLKNLQSPEDLVRTRNNVLQLSQKSIIQKQPLKQEQLQHRNVSKLSIRERY